MPIWLKLAHLDAWSAYNGDRTLFGGSATRCDFGYCPTARRKTMNRVTSRRRVEERKETDIKSAATFGKLRKCSSLGEEFVSDRSTKRNETSVGSICAK
ncbi:hypothetical protein AVEN_217931-1 [Araneus ventricosus]|uniref:Uncharacterized protein n=1 Tax=Araneus ventricosus TaxID=182803 RepID=A0A4Y2W3B8_ARAVE|nr:hypothetical protein AVEN_217931-1 [Araneus ventricosus]